MNENVGLSFGLSVLVVVFFAVVLYQPEQAAEPPASAMPEVTEAHPPEEVAPVPPPVADATEELAERAAVAPPPEAPTPAPPEPTLKPTSVAVPRAVAVDESAPVTPAPIPPLQRVGPRAGAPREPFTTARPGENLADVALRVYGSETDSDKLWRANRDLLDRPNEALREGMPIRTP